jgi:hypothetical protein
MRWARPEFRAAGLRCPTRERDLTNFDREPRLLRRHARWQNPCGYAETGAALGLSSGVSRSETGFEELLAPTKPDQTEAESCFRRAPLTSAPGYGLPLAANAAKSAIRSRTGRVEAGARTPEPASVGLTHYSPAGSRLWHLMGASASGRGCK